MGTFVRRYLELVAAGEAQPVAADGALVERVRTRMAAIPVADRYDSLFVTSIAHELYDPAQDHTRDNLQFPPITLEALFDDAGETLKVLRSQQHQRTQRSYEVPGPYTDKGHLGVLANIEEAGEILVSEEWVVPLTDEERGRRLTAHIRALALRYEENYQRHWEHFFADLEIVRPTTLTEAVALYTTLSSEPEWPVLRLIRALEDHTQWTKDIDDLVQNDGVANIINQKANTAFSGRIHGLRANFDIRKIGENVSTVPPHFSPTVKFGVPPQNANLNTTPIYQYMRILDTLKHRILDELTKDPNASPNVIALDAQRARDNTTALLAGGDGIQRRMLSEVLMEPLEIGR
jgi:type VI secretion system protein ImpL